ncbi:hypothetical protein COCNU_05G004890 [Cocos nucifera]|uniref:Uncharacterized protein n=1 Tax=Cocos nucifera TaxID=13894 RepID=A0A8K0I9M8_COCNU|nr:hypothetical protein COCNU_05G004890 [Cocos nucifera]
MADRTTTKAPSKPIEELNDYCGMIRRGQEHKKATKIMEREQKPFKERKSLWLEAATMRKVTEVARRDLKMMKSREKRDQRNHEAHAQWIVHNQKFVKYEG